MLGLTFGTGFGAGFVRDGILFLGDNSNAGEIWRFRDKLNPIMNVEEHVSIRGIKGIYAKEAGLDFNNSPEPKDIYKIFNREMEGNKEAAVKAFQNMGEAAGDAISNAITLIDGIIVIGGGLAGASKAFLPYLVKEMNSEFRSPNGNKFKRLTANVYNLENKDDLDKFLRGSVKEIPVYGSNKKIKYDPEPRIGVGITKIGTSKAISLGAYAFALNALDSK